MGLPQLFQRVGIGRVTGLGLFTGPQPQFFKQYHTQLLGRADVELLACQCIHLRLRLLQTRGQIPAELLQPSAIHRHAGLFHFGQHPAQGQLHILQQGGHALRFQLIL